MVSADGLRPRPMPYMGDGFESCQRGTNDLPNETSIQVGAKRSQSAVNLHHRFISRHGRVCVVHLARQLLVPMCIFLIPSHFYLLSLRCAPLWSTWHGVSTTIVKSRKLRDLNLARFWMSNRIAF